MAERQQVQVQELRASGDRVAFRAAEFRDWYGRANLPASNTVIQDQCGHELVRQRIGESVAQVLECRYESFQTEVQHKSREVGS